MLAGDTLTSGCYTGITVAQKTVTIAAGRCHAFTITTSAALERLDRHGEDVAHAALGLDDARRARVVLQLASQPQHLNVNAAIEDVFVDAGRLEQVLTAERAFGRLEEGQQQGIFALAQGNRRVAGVDQLAAAALELPAVEPIAAALGIRARAARPISWRRSTARTRANSSRRLNGLMM